MPARFSSRSPLLLPLAALLLVAPSVVRGQASSSVVARARVVSAEAPRLGLSLASAPVVTPVAARARRVGGAGGAATGVVQVTSTVRVAGNTGYRLFIRARGDATGLSVRDASGTFRTLDGGDSIEVARGSGQGHPREVVYRLSDVADATEPPVVYELVYDPVS